MIACNSLYHSLISTIGNFARQRAGLALELKLTLTRRTEEVGDGAVVLKFLYDRITAPWAIHISGNPCLCQNPRDLRHGVIVSAKMCVHFQVHNFPSCTRKFTHKALAINSKSSYTVVSFLFSHGVIDGNHAGDGGKDTHEFEKFIRHIYLPFI